MAWFDDMACDECLLDYITQVCGDVARSFEVVGGDVFFTTNSGLQIWEAWWFFMTADLSANLNKDVNNKYLLSTARMIHWEMDSVYLVNHVDWKWSLSKMFTKTTSIHVPLRSLDFRFRDAFLSTTTFLHATPTGGSFKSATDWSYFATRDCKLLI